jgi:hypothetical protein
MRTAFHECGHCLAKVVYGLIPKNASLIGYTGALGWASGGFFACYDLGIDWEREGPEYELMSSFGGIVADALYSGEYLWQTAREDFTCARETANHYGMDFSEILRIWVATHGVFEKYQDVLEKSAEKLYKDKVLDDQFWEGVLLGH